MEANILVGILLITIGIMGLVVAGSLGWYLWSEWKFEKKFGEGNKLR